MLSPASRPIQRRRPARNARPGGRAHHRLGHGRQPGLAM